MARQTFRQGDNWGNLFRTCHTLCELLDAHDDDRPAGHVRSEFPVFEALSSKNQHSLGEQGQGVLKLHSFLQDEAMEQFLSQ